VHPNTIDNCSRVSNRVGAWVGNYLVGDEDGLADGTGVWYQAAAN
jgi:hypothetical protein